MSNTTSTTAKTGRTLSQRFVDYLVAATNATDTGVLVRS
jgi:hypothetical protein